MEIVDYLLARKKAGGGSDVTIEQLSVTENGTYSEEGIAYSPVVVNVPAPENSYQLTDLPTGTISTIEDGTDLPMPSLKVGIEPVQDLHGYDHPWAGGAGKNLANIADRSEIVSQTTLGNVLLSAGTYTLSAKLANNGEAEFRLKIPNLPNAPLTRPSATSGTFIVSTLTFTLNEDMEVSIVAAGSASGYNGNVKDIQIEQGSTATSYSPYSNICPISGWTAANVSVSPTTSAEDGTTYNIQFKDGDNPLTVYGGTLDVTSGELTVTDAYIASYNAETLPSTWISDRDVYAEGTTPTTGAEVVYKLADSVTYHLTPTQIRTLVGNNNIWADTGDIIEGKYFRSLT